MRDALGTEDGLLVQGARGRRLHLDVDQRIGLQPDLSLWRDGQCRFVGDVKYKRIQPAENPNADIYQAVAYAIATGLDRVLLIYAASGGEPASHRIVRIHTRVDVAVLDLAAPPEGILDQIAALAEHIHRLAGRKVASYPTPMQQ